MDTTTKIPLNGLTHTKMIEEIKKVIDITLCSSINKGTSSGLRYVKLYYKEKNVAENQLKCINKRLNDSAEIAFERADYAKRFGPYSIFIYNFYHD